MTKKQKEQAEAREELLASYITPETKLTIIVKKVSASGMSRRMIVLADWSNISKLVSKLCGLNLNDYGLRVDGCGMDMTFWLADYITNCLWIDKKPEGLKGNGGSCLEWRSY